MWKNCLLLTWVALLSACGGGGTPDAPNPGGSAAQSFVVSGVISGLKAATSLDLTLDNGAGTGGSGLALSSSFQMRVPAGNNWQISIASQLDALQTCVVSNASGTAISSDISNVRIDCLGAAGTKLTAGGGSFGAVPGHVCALKSDGTGAWCWGANQRGQLGDGTNTDRLVPTSVTSPGNPLQAIAAGAEHTCATDGSGLKCWGQNVAGQLGDNTTVSRNTPMALTSLGDPIKKLAAGYSHTCALTTRNVYCWGDNRFGQLGDGTTTSRQAPVVSAINGAEVADMASAYYSTCALMRNRTVACWGAGDAGQLGNNTSGSGVTSNAPVLVQGLGDAVAISHGTGDFFCAVKATGTIVCWGDNTQGQLGTGAAGGLRTTPVAVAGLQGAIAISKGASHACALTTNGDVTCWGANDRGQLGDGSTTRRLSPVVATGVTGVQAIAAGDTFTCALAAGGTSADCWGDNSNGQLGDGTAGTATSTAVTVSGAGL